MSIRSAADHQYHVWMNRRHIPKELGGSIYAFKEMIDFLEGYGPKKIEAAFTGSLPVIHKQCSMSSPETIEKNCLKCALGNDVTECQILLSLKETFAERPSIPASELYRAMTITCAWHIYTEQIRSGEGFIDTSEGLVMDEGDRRFWQNVYDSMGVADA